VRIEIQIHRRISEIDARDWDQLVATADAPAFYSHAFLSAYERSPLQATKSTFYIALREYGQKRLLAVLPAYLQAIDDPAGDVSSVVTAPDAGSGLILLTHVVHCYDGHLPAIELSSVIVAKVVEVLADLAAQEGADYFGFLHIDEQSPLPSMLQEAGLGIVSMETRFRRTVSEFTDVEHYISSMPSYNARRNLRRGRRRADRLGIVTEPASGMIDHLQSAVDLCHLTALRHGTPSYYPRDALFDFLAGLGESLRSISVWHADTLIATALGFIDRHRYHFWASGVKPGDFGLSSPFGLLFYQAVHEAIREGTQVLEAGRGNETFKHRHGLRPVPTVGCLSRP
jgi:predicted N-acyltransferase